MVENVVEGFFESIGWSIGGAAVAVAVIVGGPRAKGLAKNAIKGYFAATQRLKEVTAETTESFQDLYAEAKHEYESQLRAEHSGATESPAAPSGPVKIEVESE